MLNQHHDGKIDRLAAIPLFANASRKALRHLAAAADEVTLAEGSKLITQGVRHHEAYIVEKGTVVVLVDGEQVAELGAGKMVGEMSLFVPGLAAASVIAGSECELLVLPHNRFDQVLDDVPTLGLELAVELARRLKETNAHFH